MKQTAFFLLIFISVLFYRLTLIDPQPKIIPTQNTIPIAKNQILPLVEEINQRNALIFSFYSDIEVQISGVIFKCKGQLAYKKNNDFRLLIRSVVGLESDLGSNTRYFWFWSKRMNDPYIYYARHEDSYRVPLKNPFQPFWMMDSLGINTLPTEKSTYKQMGDFLVIDEYCQGTEGNLLLRRILVDMRRRLFYGQYLIDNGKLVASTEVLEYQNVDGILVPKTVKIVWVEEDVALIWRFKNTRVNVSIGNEWWQLPNFTQRKNLLD